MRSTRCSVGQNKSMMASWEGGVALSLKSLQALGSLPPTRRPVMHYEQLGQMNHFTTARLSAERLREDHLADLVALHRDVVIYRIRR